MSLRFPNFEPFDVRPTLIGREFRTLGRMFFFSANRYGENCALLSKEQLQQRTKHQSRGKNTAEFFLDFFLLG